MTKTMAILTTLAFATIALAGCTSSAGDVEIYGMGGIDDNGRLIGTLSPDAIIQAGSSTVQPVAELWAEDFGGARGVQIKVGGGGSGTGGKGICQNPGSTPLDIGDQSRPMKDSEKELCMANGVDPVAWTVAIDGLSVVVAKSNDFAKDLTIEQLAMVFSDNNLSLWSDIDPSFPNTAIATCAPDEESGTWDYFDEVIMEGAELREGTQRSPDDNVLVQCIAGDSNAIGFFGYAYLEENLDKLHAVAVEGVLPTPETIADNSYTPLSRPIFMVTNGVPEEGTILYDYFHYAFHPEGGQALVPLAGYIALDENTRLDMLNRFDA